MHSPSKLPTPRRLWVWLWVWLFVAGFLWLQLAGTLHKYVHTTTSRDAPAVTSQFAKIVPDHAPSTQPQQNKSDCQLFDLQCSGLALGFAAPVVASLDLYTAFERLRFLSLAPQPSEDYQARAPPHL
jgi:hypothetical protein